MELSQRGSITPKLGGRNDWQNSDLHFVNSDFFLIMDRRMMTLEKVGEYLALARGYINRIYCHWTGAPYHMVECPAYHVVIDFGGYFHVIHEDFTRPLAHTWHRNSGSIGVALACCCDACCYYDAPSGVDFGCEPPTETQIEALAMFCAEAVERLGIDVSDIYTHAEMANMDGYGIGSGDPDMRWDLLYVPDYGDRGKPVPGGDLIRGKTRYYRKQLYI